jgi:hypothetical protein
MGPLAVLLAIVTGSAISLAVGLGMTWIVILFMPQHAGRLAAEKAPLLEAILLFSLLSVASSVSLYWEMRTSRWRLPSIAVTVVVLGSAFWVYWPR